LEVGAWEVLGVQGEGEDDEGGDDGTNGALGRERRSGDGVVLLPVAVAGDAEAGAFRRLAVAAVGLVGDAPQVLRDLLVDGTPEEGREVLQSMALKTASSVAVAASQRGWDGELGSVDKARKTRE